MIVTENLCKKYNKVEAIKNLNLNVRQGTVFGFVGENGAGKTTTLSILATLTLPTTGRAYIGGVEVTTDAPHVRRLIGYMPDQFGVYDDLTVKEYLAFYGTAYGVASSLIEERTKDLLQMVSLSSKEHFYVNSLSKGMQQRLGLARSLMHDPPVLILDEPASGLDPRSRIEMREIIKGLRERGKTILISSHILPELADMCDEIGIIAHGTLVACAGVEVVNARVQGQKQLFIEVLAKGNRLADHLMTRHDVTDILVADERHVEFLFSGSEEAQVDLFRDLSVHEFAIKSFREVGSSLEELFMRLTEEEHVSSLSS
nr:ABC transporter ATP-binding protein [Bacilli bacterium]